MSAANNTSSGVMTVVAMDATASPSAVVVNPAATVSGEEAARAAVQKRYDGLVAVRAKAIKGKGAWYWAFLEPVRVSDPDTGLAKAVKLRCSLCDAAFSASNPSRTASEHLKRGTCPNFTSPPPPAGPATPSPTSAAKPVNSMPNSSYPRPINSVPPPSSSPPSSYQVHHHHQHHQHHQQQQVHHHNRKRSSSSSHSHLPAPAACSSYQITPLPVVDPTTAHFYSPSSSSSPAAAAATPKMLALPPAPLVLSGGKEDLGKLAMLEDSVKRLKSPESFHAAAPLPKDLAEAAFCSLTDWVYQCCGAVSVSALDHPKFRAFLRQVGLPDLLSPLELLGRRLDARQGEAWFQSKARIRDALFFQVSCDGCRSEPSPSAAGMVGLTLNLPHGTSVFWKAEFVHSKLSSDQAEDVLWEAATAASEEVADRCAGIVSNRFRSALRDLEERHPWMVNLSCLLQGFRGLLKDLAREPELFGPVLGNCYKVARYFNRFAGKYGFNGLIREANPSSCSARGVEEEDLNSVFSMLEDVAANAQSFRKMLHQDEPVNDLETAEITEIMLSRSFSEELNAVLALGNTVGELMAEVKEERPFVGQCLPLWENLKSRINHWCTEHNMDQMLVAKVVERRFNKSYHPAWSAAFVLDPLYLVKETSNKYLPPFKYLSAEQQKHVDDLISRLVAPDDAHIVISELMKWRSEGLDRTYALAVQMKTTDPMTGKLRIANPQSSRLLWESQSELREFKLLGRVAARLIFLHATSSGYRCNSSFLRWIRQQQNSLAAAQKMLFVAANAKLESGDLSSEEEKDIKFFTEGDCVVPTDSDMQTASL